MIISPCDYVRAVIIDRWARIEQLEGFKIQAAQRRVENIDESGIDEMDIPDDELDLKEDKLFCKFKVSEIIMDNEFKKGNRK